MQPGKHDFDGAFCPAPGSTQVAMFSVGCFAWHERANGNGLKRGPVKVRIRGLVEDADAVYARARAVCDALDDGTYLGPRIINLPSRGV